MKSFRLNLEDRFQVAVLRYRSTGKGRIKRGTQRKMLGTLGPKALPSQFYLQVANLPEDKIDDFIRNYQVALPEISGGNRIATRADILTFKKELRDILHGVKDIKKLRKNIRIAFTEFLVARKTGGLPSIVNKYLEDCYLQLGFPPIVSQRPTKADLKSYADEVYNFSPRSTGQLQNNIFPKAGWGTNFPLLVCRCRSLLSWCVLDLLIDLVVRGERIHVCELCGRLFKAQKETNVYCKDPRCQREAQRLRQRKSRAKAQKQRP